MSALLICNFESFVTAFHLRCEEWEIHLICSHQTRYSLPITNRGLQLLKLVRGECRRFKSYSKVRLRPRTLDKRDGFDLAFIDGFDQVLKMCCPITSYFFWSRNDQPTNILNNSCLILV